MEPHGFSSQYLSSDSLTFPSPRGWHFLCSPSWLPCMILCFHLLSAMLPGPHNEPLRLYPSTSDQASPGKGSDSELSSLLAMFLSFLNFLILGILAHT